MSKEKKDKGNVSKEEDAEGESLDEENSEEELIEEDEEELEEIVQEEDYYENMALNRFLFNSGKQVSLDERNIIPVSNLENDLPKRKLFQEEEQKNFEYNLFKEKEKGIYQTAESQGQFMNSHLTEEEKKLNELKRMYDNPRRLSSDFQLSQNNEPKYVKIEDTKRTDYLSKKKFGDV